METPRRTTARRDPVELVWAALAVLLPVLVSLLSRMGTIDLAYQIRAGNEVLAGSIPRIDTYTFSAAGRSWTDQQWLAQGVLAAVDRVGGWASLAALQAVLIGLTFGLLYLAVRSGEVGRRSASLLTLAGFVVAAPGLALRPQLFAMPLFAGLLLIVGRRRRHPAWLWLSPVLAALCANIHGSFPLFPVVVGLAWLEDRRVQADARRTLVVALVTALATLIGPFGPGVWSYAYELSTNPVIRDTITEWAPLTIGTTSGWLAVASAFGVVAYLVRRRSPIPWTALLTLALFFLLALSAQRALVWWGLVAPVVVGSLMGSDREREDPSPERAARDVGVPAPAYAMIGVLVLAVVALLPWWRGSDPSRFLRDAPFGLTQATGSLPTGSRLLVYQPWGSWFEYAVPGDPVFVDSRIEVPPRAVWDDYADISSANARWSDIVDSWNVDAIVAPNDWGLVPILEAPGSGWQVAYRDADGAVFTRESV